MNLRRSAPPRPRETVVALIDVTFFLLIFFMLVGRLDATAPFAVVPPLGTTGTNLPAGGLTLSVAPDGALALDGALITRETLAQTLSPKLLANSGILIRINADAKTELSLILPLIAQLEAIGAANVALIVTPSPR